MLQKALKAFQGYFAYIMSQFRLSGSCRTERLTLDEGADLPREPIKLHPKHTED